MNFHIAGAAALLALAPSFCASASAEGVGTVEVLISGIRNNHGNVHVELCPKALFLKDCPYTGEVRAQAGTVLITVPNVPPGHYAAQATHDENDDHKLQRNLFGIPKEGFAFSRDVKICFGPPKFDQAAFDYAGGKQRIAFHMAYGIC
jgi:uncharacterized protein (DUF2141 family)